MASRLEDFLDELATVLGAVVPSGGGSALGAGNVFVRTPPKTITQLPAIVGIIGTATGPSDNKEQRGGEADVAYHPIMLMFLADVANVNDLTTAYPDAMAWYQPLRNALVKDNKFNNTCTDAKLLDSTPNELREYLDGKTYFGHVFNLRVRIDEPTT
jgi:hypothetical protein